MAGKHCAFHLWCCAWLRCLSTGSRRGQQHDVGVREGGVCQQELHSGLEATTGSSGPCGEEASGTSTDQLQLKPFSQHRASFLLTTTNKWRELLRIG